mmetsp:Transcript_9130/g.19810  ORF Transcript_9130/g.19810 Transcript_9130/m.19810 type:complete len:345 (+) Transcript_9130:327-1361(+)
MLVPEEYRCCVCLCAPEQPLQTGCPHRLCMGCVTSGKLDSCPVCRAELPAEHSVDETFKRTASNVTLQCGCGVTVDLFEADGHQCEHTRKRKRLEEISPHLQGRKVPPAGPNRSTFSCPFCPERNLTPQALTEHVEAKHSLPHGRGSPPAVCPICLAMPWGETGYMTRDFLSHLKMRHRCDYTVLTDFDADEEAMFERAMRDSMRSAGFLEEADEDERILAQVLEMSAREAMEGSTTAGSDESGRGSRSSSGSSLGNDNHDDEMEDDEEDDHEDRDRHRGGRHNHDDDDDEEEDGEVQPCEEDEHGDGSSDSGSSSSSSGSLAEEAPQGRLRNSLLREEVEVRS